MKTPMIVSALGAFLLTTSLVSSGENAHWSYAGEDGPANWGSLDPEYAACSDGKNQSPIDLSGFVDAELADIEFNYEANATEILNNGHTVQANFASGSTISISGRNFELLQFHFHTPSENTINGKSFPLEAHLVHGDAAGNLAVISVMFEQGAENDTLATLWNQMPNATGDKNALNENVNAKSLLPENKDYYRFNGSLTTPPCTEGLWWFVLKNPVTVSVDQVELFLRAVKYDNNRPIQATNARPILQ